MLSTNTAGTLSLRIWRMMRATSFGPASLSVEMPCGARKRMP